MGTRNWKFPNRNYETEVEKLEIILEPGNWKLKLGKPTHGTFAEPCGTFAEPCGIVSVGRLAGLSEGSVDSRNLAEPSRNFAIPFGNFLKARSLK